MPATLHSNSGTHRRSRRRERTNAAALARAERQMRTVGLAVVAAIIVCAGASVTMVGTALHGAI